MATRNIVPRATGEGGIGTTAKKWALGWINALVVVTLNALTLTAAATGFTIEGGTTSKTLTVTADTSLDEAVAMSSKAPKASPTFTTKITTPIVDLTGGQIAFPAAQAASAGANTLDDYEENDFTPVITFGGGSTGITYSAAYSIGAYTKIGRQVSFTGLVTLTSKGTSTGAVLIGGLPFASVNAAKYRAVMQVFPFVNVTFANQFFGILLQGSATIALYEAIEAGGTATTITDANFSNDSTLWFAGTYFTA